MNPIPSHALPAHPQGLVWAGAATGLLVVLAVVMIFVLRKALRRGSEQGQGDWSKSQPDIDSPSAFVTASMQGVIEKLRAQEKELARLHLLAQERAQESERLTEEVTRNMPTGLLLLSATGAITTANPAAEEALGTRQLRYRSYKEVLRGEDADLVRMLTACLREGKTFQRSEVEHLTPDGEVRRLGVTISPIYRAQRSAQLSSTPAQGSTEIAHTSPAKPHGALCLMSDLTELTALQKQMRWKENLAALGEMSAGIAHEFKNALATISGYAQMIRSESDPREARDSAGRILDQTKALTHVVTEFLRFAKPLEISYETVPMQAVIERLAGEIQENGRATIEIDGTFADLPGDEALLRQALVNLTRNAVEAATATGAAPCVRVTGTVEDLGNRKWQRISVSDNGPGIPENDLSKIFLPFFTTKSEGTGLGLAVVQKIALQHGGSIEAHNSSPGGAEFLLWLPLRQEVSPSLFPSQAARI